jgi:two-component system, OmpR family, sensor histidine kinase BaeS
MQSGVDKLTFDRTEVLDRIRQQWLSNLAHNLSGPLFTARGYIRMALQTPEGDSSENHARYLTLALENIDKLGALVREMENLPSAGDFDFEPLSLRELLVEAIAEIAPVLEAKRARLRQDLGDGPMATTGDRGKLGQALGGFLAAAARAVDPGGDLEISAAEADGLVAIRLTAGSTNIHPEFEPDISLPSRLWQSHGGSTGAHQAETQYSLTCELAVIRL